MKGIAHFAAAVAVTSCFPAAIRAGADGDPGYFILAAVFGLLPDTIDFRFLRFFYKHDITITPDPLDPDPEAIADAVADAADRVSDCGKPVTIKLNTMRLGADRWRRYSLQFDVPNRKVCVEIGPEVDTGQHMVGHAPVGEAREASVSIVSDVSPTYEATIQVDIFDGPSLELVPEGDLRVTARLIPWHRRWSHSCVMLLLPALGAAVLDPLAGLVIYAAGASHILLDQLGFMGSALLYPFHRRRYDGFKLSRSGESLPNAVTVWLSCLLVFWNLYMSVSWTVPGLNIMSLLAWGALIPISLARMLMHRSR